MRELTHAEARERARELATPISDMVQPRHVGEGEPADWEAVDPDTLRAEVSRSVDIFLSELHHHSALRDVMHDRALTHHKNNMQRVPLDDLRLSRTEAVGQMYWPYDMTHGDVMAALREHYTVLGEVPSADYHAARKAVAEGLREGMAPEGVEL